MTIGQYLITVLFISYLLIVFSLPVNAQVVNVERHRVLMDTTDVWTGGLGFGWNISRNNTRIVRFNTTADITYVARKHDFLVLGRNNFLRVDGNNVLNDGFIHLRSVLYRDNKFAPEFFLQAQYNIDWGLKRRALAGSNIRIRLKQSEQFSAFLSTGLMLENEIWEEPDGELRAELNQLKSTTSFNIGGKLFDNLELTAISYYQARPDRFFKPRFTSDWLIRFYISEHLRFAIQFVSTYDSNPPLDTVRFIYNINNLLELRF